MAFRPQQRFDRTDSPEKLARKLNALQTQLTRSRMGVTPSGTIVVSGGGGAAGATGATGPQGPAGPPGVMLKGVEKNVMAGAGVTVTFPENFADTDYIVSVRGYDTADPRTAINVTLTKAVGSMTLYPDVDGTDIEWMVLSTFPSGVEHGVDIAGTTITFTTAYASVDYVVIVRGFTAADPRTNVNVTVVKSVGSMILYPDSAGTDIEWAVIAP